MKKTSLLVLFGLLILRGSIFAQNPYESLGKVAPVLTLSEGKYEEFMTNDTIVQIGSVLFNTLTNEVVSFVDEDSVRLTDADMTTRFLSVDPLGRKFPELTPYQFASNTPIQGIDLDGLEIIYHWEEQKQKYNGFAKVLELSYASQLFGQAQNQFKTGNTGVDIYIISEPNLPASGRTVYFSNMGTSPEKRKNVLESIENNAQAISHFSSEDTYSEGVTESKKFLNYIDEQSLKKGHSVVLIKLKREDLNNANTNATELVKAAFTLIHEMEFHGLDYKDKKDDKPAEDEHIENYKDPKFYKINSGEYSPTYENIKLKSRAGEIKKIIEETLKKMQEQKKAENAPQKPVEKPKKVKGA